MVKSIDSLRRGMLVLRAMQRRHHCSLAELYHETGIPRPTLRRILKTLIQSGAVYRSGCDDLYRVSDTMLDDGPQLPGDRLIARCAEPLFDAFHKRVGVSISLGVRDGDKVAIILSTVARHPDMKGRYTATGGRVHMLPSALGRAIVGSLGEAERGALLARLSASAEEFDRVTAIDGGVEAIVAELRDLGYGARSLSYWDSYSEASVALRAIAVPVLWKQRPIASIALAWPDDRPFDGVVNQALAPLIQVARDLEDSLAATRGSELLDMMAQS